jgi:phage recombination protein Bet
MAARLNVEPAKMMGTLKDTVFAKATDSELMALVVVANEFGLNPFLKELYAFPAKGGGIVPIVSVDGWNKMLTRHPSFNGMEFSFVDDPTGSPYSCTATVHVKGRDYPTVITEYYDECRRETQPWKDMPRRMLRNRTLCQAARIAFGFSGVVEEDEARQGGMIVDVSEAEQPTIPRLNAPPSEFKTTPQQDLEAAVLGAGFTFDLFRKLAIDTGIVNDASSIGSFAEIPTEDAKRVMRGVKTMLKTLGEMAETK